MWPKASKKRITMNRRQFILSGLALGTTVTLGLNGYQLLNSDDTANSELVLAALLPALLYGALPTAPAESDAAILRTIAAVHDSLAFLPLRQQQELQLLFNLLAQRLGRLALSGHWLPLAELSLPQRLTLFARWRDSYLGVLQQAYHGLRELLFAAYYSQPEHWATLNYTAPRFR